MYIYVCRGIAIPLQVNIEGSDGMITRFFTMLLLLLLLLAPHGIGAHNTATAEILPLNSMVTVTAPAAPLDRNRAPKNLARYYWSSYAPCVRVYRFIVEPGKKYTFYFQHPADGMYRNAMIKTETPLHDDLHTYTKKGYAGFVTYAQQPWKDPKGHLRRHTITISPESDNPNLYMILQCAKPGISAAVMLKSPPDSDDDVKKTTGNGSGTIWRTPLVLTTVPGATISVIPSPTPGTTSTGTPTATPSIGITQSTPVTTLTAASLGGTWTVNEGGRWFGTWIRRPGTRVFDATWKNNSGQVVKDVITIESLQGNRIVLIRQGNGGRYYGILSGDGKAIANGTTS